MTVSAEGDFFCADASPNARKIVHRAVATTRKQNFINTVSSCASGKSLERRRSIYPQQPGFCLPRILPAVRCGTLKVEAVAGPEQVVLVLIQPDFEMAAQNVKKFLAFVRVRLAAVAARLDAEKMRFHGSVAPGEQFHANAFGGFEDFAFSRFHHARVLFCRLEEGKNIGPVIARDTAQSGDRCPHLSAFKRAQKADRNVGGFCNLGQRESAPLAKAAEARTGRDRIFRRDRNDTLPFKDMNDSRGI